MRRQAATNPAFPVPSPGPRGSAYRKARRIRTNRPVATNSPQTRAPADSIKSIPSIFSYILPFSAARRVISLRGFAIRDRSIRFRKPSAPTLSGFCQPEQRGCRGCFGGVKAKTLFRRFCKQPPSAISCRYSALRIRVSAPRASLSFFAGNIGKAKCERTFLDTSIISKIFLVVQYTKTPFFQKAGFTCVT